MLGRLFRRQPPGEPDRSSLAWRLRHDNPRHLDRKAYVAEMEAQKAALATTELEVDELAEAREMVRAMNRRGQAIRQRVVTPEMTRDQQIARFEAEMARDAARRR